MKALQKFFTSEKTFALFAGLTAIAGLFEGSLCFITNDYSFIFIPFLSVMAIVMYVSYSRHQKNVMKSLMGASLLWSLSEEVGYLERVLEADQAHFSSVYGGSLGLYAALKAVTIAVTLAIFLMHLVISADRKSSPKAIRLNQLFFFLLLLLYLLDAAMTAAAASFDVNTFFLIVFKLCLTLLVLCIESNLEEFRLLREAKGWTGENDYSKK